jgi:VWFA-related protein
LYNGAVPNRALLILIPCATLLAQTPSFRVSTRLIQVNVVVTDRQGDPVTGLTKDDFTISDQGKQQKIVFFSQQDLRVHAREAAAARPVFSNRPQETAAAAGSATVVLFDRLNTKFLDAGFARARLTKFLSGVRADDRIALYGLSDRLVILQDFTQDASALLHALELYKPTESNETRATTFKEANGPHGLMNWFENKGNQRESDTLMTGRVEATAYALEAIANHLAGLPGRKNLVWLSASFPISIGYFQKRIMGANPGKEHYDTEVENAARALSNADVAIYPVDAHVLGTLGGIFDSSTAPKPGIATLGTTVPLPESTINEETGTMTRLAEMTGGRVFNNNNDIGGAVRRAIDDSAFTYTIGYYPDHGKWDGKFREIKVKVARSGVDTRYRSGYLAVAETTAVSRPTSLAELIRRPLESSELGLSIEIEKLAARQFKLHIRIDASGLRLEQKDGRWTGDLEVLWTQEGADGRELTGHGQTLHFRLSPETYASLPREGLKISSIETIAEGAAQLRFGARAPDSGVLGSVYVPVPVLMGAQ